MYIVYSLGSLRLQIFEQLKSDVATTDFCATSATIEFAANNGLLEKNLILFKLTLPGFELEALCRDGIVFIRRNGLYQHSEQIRGCDRLHVALQWTIDSIGCGIAPWTGDRNAMNYHMRSIRTPYTTPPIELHRILRANNLLSGNEYRSADDLFATIIDCLSFVEEDIRKFGGERFAWGKKGDPNQPLDEPDISQYIAPFLALYGAMRNFDVSCEPRAGDGNVDFCIVAPVEKIGLVRVAIEAKKANNANLSHGLTTQLPAYMSRLKASHGIFLIYWLKSSCYPYPSQATFSELEDQLLHGLPRAPGIRPVSINLSKGPSPSRL